MARKRTIQLLFALVFTIFATHQVWGEQECYKEKDQVKTNCMRAIGIHGDYARPSKDCCQIVKHSDMICICRILKPIDEVNISVVKLVHVASVCGKPLPSGTKCGSKYQILIILIF